MSPFSHGKTRPRRTGAPDYDEPEYWDRRFATGQDVGEWLNSGEMLVDAVVSHLKQSAPDHETRPRVLHLGPGISKLGTRVRDAFVAQGWAANGIVNVDFSSEAVRLGQALESKQDPSHAMHWVHADLLSWTEMSRRLLPSAPFDVILDKSTCDAIATARSVTFTTANASEVCPTVLDIVADGGEVTLAPVELLALHLAPLTRKGSMWFALSYSTIRFDNLRHVPAYWELVGRTPLQGPRGQTVTGTHTPDVYHWVYVLRRR